MIASRRSMKIRVVCTLEFVLGLDIDGDTEVGSLGGLTDSAYAKASKLIFNLSHQNDHAKIGWA
jgi:hypothetical protein